MDEAGTPKDGKIRDTNTLNLSRNIVSLQALGRCFAFFTLHDQLVVQQNICCRLKKVVAKSRARIYFEEESLALLLVSRETHNLSRNKFADAVTNQPISVLYFFNPQPATNVFVDKLITQL